MLSGPQFVMRAAASLCLSLPAAAAAAEDAGRVWVNGVQFEVGSTVLAGEPNLMARRLEGRWGERLAGVSPSASRQIFGRQRGPFHETLTVLPGPKPGTSRFVVAVQDLRQPPAAKPDLPLPLPAAARLVNVVQFDASTNSAAAFTVDAPGTPGGALRRLWRVAETRGWRAVATPPAIAQPGAAIWARRGNRQMTIVALPASGRARLVLLVAGDEAEAAR